MSAQQPEERTQPNTGVPAATLFLTLSTAFIVGSVSVVLLGLMRLNIQVFGVISTLLLVIEVVAVLKVGEWSLRLVRAIPRNTERILANSIRRPVLYLRSFDIDDEVGASWKVQLVRFVPVTVFSVRSETSLVRQLKRVGPVVALGRPDEKIPRLGALRYYASDDEWQDVIHRLMETAQLIVFKPGKSLSLFWEFGEVMTRPAFIPFLICAHGGEGPLSELAYYTFAERFERTFGIHIPSEGAKGVLAFYSNHDRPVVCANVAEACESIGVPIRPLPLLFRQFQASRKVVKTSSRVSRTIATILMVAAAIASFAAVFIVFIEPLLALE